MYKYQFTSTVEDLLEAEEAERSARLARAPFRWAIAVLGVVWFLAGIFSFEWSNPSWRPLVWLSIGIGIFYYFMISPYKRRNIIRKENAPQQDVVLSFSDDCIKLRIGDVGNFTRQWEEIVEVIDAQKGIVFLFSDGVANWIPNRVFSNEGERRGFLGFLKNRYSQEK